MLVTVARARKGNVIGQRSGKPFWEKNELFLCCIVQHFLVRNKYESDTYLKTELNYQDVYGKSKQWIEISASEEVPDIFFVACIVRSTVQM